MNALRGLALIVTTAVVLASPADVRATVQSLDIVRFEGQDRAMLEVPLNDLIWELDLPFFDAGLTSNHKGYFARWEVKDGALLLTSFEAKLNGKAVPVETILPGKKLPARAEWYTGRIRILIGPPIKRGNHGVGGAVYPRVVVLHLAKGKVVKTEELKNTRIKSYTEERDAERARRWLWSFPRLPAGTAVTFSIPDRERAAVVVVPPHVVRRTPAWAKDRPDPPLSALNAMLRAEAASREYLPPGARFTWGLSDVKLKQATGDWYYYQVSFWPDPPEAASPRQPQSLRLIVLMDGTVPRLEYHAAYGFIRTVTAGGFTVEGVPTESRQATWEWSDYGAPWSEIPGWARAPLVISTLTAPRLLYTVDKFEVYRNAVWAEYTVTNGTSERKYVPPERLHVPLRNAGFWDDTGRKWPIPQPSEPDGVGKPTEFVPIEPRQSVRFRVDISHPTSRPFQPFGRIEGPPGRPAALEYFIHAWPNMFTRPSAESEAQLLAFGYGRVPVAWFDRDSPKERPRQLRFR